MKNKKLQEAALVRGRRSFLGIYQVKEGKRDYLFAGTRELGRRGLGIHRGNYELVYVEPLRFTDTLEQIYQRFNLDRPEDFTGRSLSVSDIVVQNREGNVSAAFVDSFGFAKTPEFIDEILQANDMHILEELDALQLGDTVRLSSGTVLRISEMQEIDWHGWEQTLCGTDPEGRSVRFHIAEVEQALVGGQEYFRPEQETELYFYVTGSSGRNPLLVHPFANLSEAVEYYRGMPPEHGKTLGIENRNIGNVELVRYIDGSDVMTADYKRLRGGWNPAIFAAVQELKKNFFNRAEEIKEGGVSEMSRDARSEWFELVEIDGVEALFTNARLDRDTVPEGLYCYDVRETDGFSGIPATLERYVMANHWGTVLSKQEFPMENGYYGVKEDGFNYLGEMVTLEEYMQETQEQKPTENGMDFTL
ncbi:MAG: hypothetical protein HFE61_10895 [Anaerotignum sp.]|nr:hypothetical protein [Anaerotignum sp.]